MKRFSLVLILLLFLFSLLVSFQKINIAKASSTIYIRADGSVDPSTAPIEQNGNICIFTANISDSIVIERNDIVVDGDGYSIQGPGTYPYIGIDLSGRNNVTIKNMEIRAFGVGIYLSDSLNNNISGNVVTRNGWSPDQTAPPKTGGGGGISLHSSSYNSISGNNIRENWWAGIWLINSSHYNSVSGNNLSDNRHAIRLDYCPSNNTISENNVANNMDGILLYEASNNDISRNDVTNNSVGIEIYYSNNNTICENAIANNSLGVEAFGSLDNSIYHNDFLNNTSQAIQGIVEGVGGVNFWDNGVEGNYWSDYHGHDFDKNGIGDTPYILYIDERAESHPQDRYPLITPYHSNHLSLTDYAIAVTVIVGGTLLIGTFLLVRIKKSTMKSE